VKPQYPKDHKPGMRVPHGGSSCAKCEYYRPGNRCSNDYFVAWHGSDKIPAPASEYCSDWFEPRKSKYKMREAESNQYANDRMLNQENY